FFFSVRCRHPASSLLFPYTTLFRSHQACCGAALYGSCNSKARKKGAHPCSQCATHHAAQACAESSLHARLHHVNAPQQQGGEARSEEHTSELQSRENLVCRLLLEKK